MVDFFGSGSRQDAVKAFGDLTQHRADIKVLGPQLRPRNA